MVTSPFPATSLYANKAKMNLSLTKNSVEIANLSKFKLLLKDKNEYTFNLPNA